MAKKADCILGSISEKKIVAKIDAADVERKVEFVDGEIVLSEFFPGHGSVN